MFILALRNGVLMDLFDYREIQSDNEEESDFPEHTFCISEDICYMHSRQWYSCCQLREELQTCSIVEVHSSCVGINDHD